MSPYLKSLTLVAANKLVHLMEIFSTKKFLSASENNHHLIFFLLEVRFLKRTEHKLFLIKFHFSFLIYFRFFLSFFLSFSPSSPKKIFNNLIQYQFEGNQPLVYVLIRRRASFVSLADLPKIMFPEVYAADGADAGAVALPASAALAAELAASPSAAAAGAAPQTPPKGAAAAASAAAAAAAAAGKKCIACTFLKQKKNKEKKRKMYTLCTHAHRHTRDSLDAQAGGGADAIAQEHGRIGHVAVAAVDRARAL